MTSEVLYTTPQLAELLEITPRTLRFYEDKGLLSPRRLGNTRVYTHREVGRLKIILRGKRLGFSLADIREYLDLYDLDTTQTEQIRLLIDKVRARLDDLEGQRHDLETAIAELTDIERQAVTALEERLRKEA